jgi:hypothetical protein
MQPMEIKKNSKIRVLLFVFFDVKSAPVPRPHLPTCGLKDLALAATLC